MVSVFMGYDSKPEVNRETLHDTARGLTEQGTYIVTSWEDLRVDGQTIIRTITAAIDRSEVALFDLTTLNPNVLFEVGYSIATKRRLGLLLEKANLDAYRNFKRFGLLAGVGFFGWSNRDSLVAKISSGEFEANEPIGDSLVVGVPPLSDSSLLFVPALHQSEPDTRIRAVMQRAADQRIDVVLADPHETRLEALSWYVGKAYSCTATLLHFESPRRVDHAIHNARLALVGGLACGFGRTVLMIADEAYDVPLDYQDLLKRYSKPSEAELLASAWIEQLSLSPPARRRRHVELAVELRSLSFGEHVAENERHDLPDYFIETAEYLEVLRASLAIFVGRKGTGKSANLFLAAANLQAEPRNLVVVIRPASYDFDGLINVVSTYPDQFKDYAIDGMWKLLLMSEVARAVVDKLESRPSHVPLTARESEFLDTVTNGPVDVRADFGSRIDAAISQLKTAAARDVSSRRDALNEALHSEWIGRMRRLIAPMVLTYDRVAILVDNLDKGWERSADLDVLSDILLGVLSAVGRVERELTREITEPRPPKVTLSVFLRSDIFAYMKERAREPDKIVAAMVEWRDASLLRRVIEERFVASRSDDTSAGVLWSRFFCPSVRGISTPDYLLGRVLPRPRDLIFLCNAAVGHAINHGHQRVEPDDILAAERDYSLFAFEALLVENGITVEEFEAVLLEFLGAEPVQSKQELLDLIEVAGIHGMKAEQVFARLKAVSFLGIETHEGEFEFPEIGRAAEKAEILARKHSKTDADTLHIVHPAYRAFLEIKDPPSTA